MRTLAAFVSGLLFAAGLVLGGMTLPENIVGFLDFFGHWKPALAGVMGGAVGVYALLYPWVLKRKVPLFAPSFDLPGPGKPSARLLTGAALFGIGWGLSGVCPGPAVAALVTGAPEAVVFAVSLAAGIGVFHLSLGTGEPGSADDSSACG